MRFWLAYSERARSLLRCSPVLAWLRDCFDPERHPVEDVRRAMGPDRRGLTGQGPQGIRDPRRLGVHHPRGHQLRR